MKVSRRDFFRRGAKDVMEMAVPGRISERESESTGGKRSLGLVISSVDREIAFVHLHLESRRRSYPDVRILVCAAESAVSTELEAICRTYDVHLTTSSMFNADEHVVASIVKGLEWAAAAGIDLVAVMSSDFIPLYDWATELRRLNAKVPAPTYGNRLVDSDGPLRIECMAFDTRQWSEAGILNEMHQTVAKGVVEDWSLADYLGSKARSVWKNFGLRQSSHIDAGYQLAATWNLVASNEIVRTPHVLWRHSSDAVEYCRAGIQYGIIYPICDWEFSPSNSYADRLSFAKNQAL